MNSSVVGGPGFKRIYVTANYTPYVKSNDFADRKISTGLNEKLDNETIDVIIVRKKPALSSRTFLRSGFLVQFLKASGDLIVNMLIITSSYIIDEPEGFGG